MTDFDEILNETIISKLKNVFVQTLYRVSHPKQILVCYFWFNFEFVILRHMQCSMMPETDNASHYHMISGRKRRCNTMLMW